MRAALPLALALLLATAGCSGLVSPGETADSIPSETETLTPVQYTPSPSPLRYPPGLNETGVTYGLSLANAHAGTLEDTSFTVVEVATYQHPNGTTIQNVTERVRVGTDPRHYRYRQDVNGTFPGLSPRYRTSLRASNTTLVAEKRILVRGQPRYRLLLGPNGDSIPPNQVYHGTPRNRDELARFFEGSTFSVTETGDSFRLRATGFEVGATRLLGGGVANGTVTSFTAVVGSDGRVSSYRIAFEGELRNTNTTFEAVKRVRYTAVGNTTVPEPAWFEEAVDDHEEGRQNATATSRALAPR